MLHLMTMLSGLGFFLVIDEIRMRGKRMAATYRAYFNGGPSAGEVHGGPTPDGEAPRELVVSVPPPPNTVGLKPILAGRYIRVGRATHPETGEPCGLYEWRGEGL